MNEHAIPDGFDDWEQLGYVKSLLHYRVGLPLNFAT